MAIASSLPDTISSPPSLSRPYEQSSYPYPSALIAVFLHHLNPPPSLVLNPTRPEVSYTFPAAQS
jgi:hypothetical protein